MNAKRILEMVNDLSSWRGDVYRLALAIAQEQKESDAKLAEDMNASEVAEAIRAAG